jgi:outer membrane protein assembly factor BamD
MQVAMAHYRQMEKPDRDRTETIEAEAEFQTFLEKYPSSPLAPQAEQRLREVQEVLAEGGFRIARFYYMRGAYKASGARLTELTNRYPLYSEADQANWMLGQIYEKAERNDLAAMYYARIAKDYPLSPLAPDAKARLVKFGVPVPQPDPAAVARMKKDRDLEAHERPNAMRRSVGALKNGPDITAAAHSGDPTMTPASQSGDETLSFGQPAGMAIGGGGGASGNNATIETVTPGTTAPSPQPAATPTPQPAASPSTQPAATPDATPAASSTGANPPADGSASSTSGQSTTGTTTSQPTDQTQESTSKKKKGIHKIIPW